MDLSAPPQDRATAWLTAWDSHGFHRTGTEGDAAGADWLRVAASALGATVVEERFWLDRLTPLEAFVEFDGKRIDGEPMFDAPDTPEGGVSGHDGEEVGIVEASPHSVYRPEFRGMRLSLPRRPLVLVTQGETPGLALINAEGFNAPYGPPILQIGSEHTESLRTARARGARLRIVTRSERRRVEARNTVVTVAGRDKARPPLVVMTPRSSWFNSTSERGGGLVCWLESLRAILAAPEPARDVIFSANSGHELGHLGLDAFLASRPGWDTEATWVHFGANIDAAGGELRLMSATDALRTLAADALRRAGRPADQLCPPALTPSGETRDIHRAGGSYVTLVGTNKLFHLQQDRWPGCVDVDRLTRTAQGAAELVLALSRV